MSGGLAIRQVIPYCRSAICRGPRGSFQSECHQDVADTARDNAAISWPQPLCLQHSLLNADQTLVSSKLLQALPETPSHLQLSATSVAVDSAHWEQSHAGSGYRGSCHVA